MILPDAPDAAAGEITDKGSVNQNAVLTRRQRDVARLYATPADAVVIDLVEPATPRSA